VGTAEKGLCVIYALRSDVLHGELGKDVLDGGAGADTYFGDAGNDRLVGGDRRSTFGLGGCAMRTADHLVVIPTDPIVAYEAKGL
jgi:hypothetical protein